MATGTLQLLVTVAGESPEPRVQVLTANGKLAETPTLPAAIAGTVNAGGDGIDGLPTGHGITVAESVTIAWVGGVRYECTVDSATTNEIIVSKGAGDALPAENTAVFVGVEQTVIFPIDGDNISLLLVDCHQRSMIVFHRTEPAIIGISDTAGVIDGLPTGHGIQNTDMVTVRWTGAVRYGCTVDSAAANEIETSGGTGTALPVDTTPVTVEVEEVVKGQEILQETIPFNWFTGCGYANPIIGEPCSRVVVANCTATAAVMTILAIFNPLA